MDNQLPVCCLDWGSGSGDVFEGLTLLESNPVENSRYKSIQIQGARHALNVIRHGEALIKDLYSNVDTFIDGRLAAPDVWLPLSKMVEIGDVQITLKWKHEANDSDNEVPPSPEAKSYTPRRGARSEKMIESQRSLLAEVADASLIVPATQCNAPDFDSDDEMIFIPATQSFEGEENIPMSLAQSQIEDFGESQLLPVKDMSSVNTSMKLVWDESREKPEDVCSTSTTPDLDENELNNASIRGADLQALFAENTSDIEIIKGTPEPLSTSALSEALEVPVLNNSAVHVPDDAETESDDEFFSASSAIKSTKKSPEKVEPMPPILETPTEGGNQEEKEDQSVKETTTPTTPEAELKENVGIRPQNSNIQTSQCSQVFKGFESEDVFKKPVSRTKSPHDLDDIFMQPTQPSPSVVKSVRDDIFDIATQPFIPAGVERSIYEAQTQIVQPEDMLRLWQNGTTRKSPCLDDSDTDNSDTDIPTGGIFKQPPVVDKTPKSSVMDDSFHVQTPDFFCIPPKLNLNDSCSAYTRGLEKTKSKTDFEASPPKELPKPPLLVAAFKKPPEKVAPRRKFTIKKPPLRKAIKMEIDQEFDSPPIELALKPTVDPNTPRTFDIPQPLKDPVPAALEAVRSKSEFESKEEVVVPPSTGVSGLLGTMRLTRKRTASNNEERPKVALKIRKPNQVRGKASPVVTVEQVKSKKAVKKEETLSTSLTRKTSASSVSSVRSTRSSRKDATATSSKSNTRERSLSHSSNASNSSSRGSFDEIHSLMFTKVNHEPYVEKIKLSKCTIAKEPTEATILIAEKIFRTYKFLAALAAGIPIVSVEWLKKLPRSRNAIDTYLLNDPEGEKKFGFKLSECFNATRNNGPVFRGKQVFVSRNSQPSPDEVKVILDCCGGHFEDDLSKMDENLDRVVVVADKKDTAYIKMMKQKAPKILIITGEGFMSSILKCKMCTGKGYRL